MPIIVDTNIAPAFFLDASSPYIALRIGVTSGSCQLHYGGSVQKKEIKKNHEIQKIYLEWKRAGRAREIDGASVDARSKTLGSIKSDDPHIIALALVGGARLLCSKDAALIRDFTNTRLVPAGNVYPNRRPPRRTHLRLVRTHCP